MEPTLESNKTETTLSSVLSQLSEIEEIMSDTEGKLEFVCNEGTPKEGNDKAAAPNFTLQTLQIQTNNLRRIANHNAQMTGTLIGN